MSRLNILLVSENYNIGVAPTWDSAGNAVVLMTWKYPPSHVMCKIGHPEPLVSSAGSAIAGTRGFLRRKRRASASWFPPPGAPTVAAARTRRRRGRGGPRRSRVPAGGRRGQLALTDVARGRHLFDRCHLDVRDQGRVLPLEPLNL